MRKYKLHFKALDAKKPTPKEGALLFKAEDSNYTTFVDQQLYEVYDLYDLEAKERVPQIVRDASVLGRSRFDSNTVRIQINYPVVGTVFSLAGSIGVHPLYVEAGKKAFVRGGRYKHPVKGWKSEIKMMSPEEYIERSHEMFVSNGSKRTLEEVIESRNDYDVVEFFDKHAGDINYLVLDYSTMMQEGLHRAIYAFKKGITQVPVIVYSR